METLIVSSVSFGLGVAVGASFFVAFLTEAKAKAAELEQALADAKAKAAADVRAVEAKVAAVEAAARA